MSARESMKWLPIVVSFALGCAPISAASASGPASARFSAFSSRPASSSAAQSTKKKRRRHYSRRQPFQKAPTPDRISEIQAALARNGYYHGDPNGKWDASSVTAMHKFQADHGLDSTGKIDALSLQKLGLGSAIAGVSAPRPVLPASAPSPVTPSSKSEPKSPDTAPTGTPSASAVVSASAAVPAASPKPQPQQ